MKQNYQTAIDFILKWEGGYVNHPKDPGGHTNYGITLKTAQTYWKHDATPEDLRSIPMAVVHDIYRKNYANKVSFDELPSGLDLLAFDAAVLSGPGRAKEWLKGNPSIADFQAKRLAFYKSLKHWPTFGKGWTRRIDAGTKTATDLASPGGKLAKEIGPAIGTGGVIISQTPGLPTSTVPVESVLSGTIGPIIVMTGIVVLVGLGYYIYNRYKKYKELTTLG